VVADNSGSGATTSTRIEDSGRNPQIISGQKSAWGKRTVVECRQRRVPRKLISGFGPLTSGSEVDDRAILPKHSANLPAPGQRIQQTVLRVSGDQSVLTDPVGLAIWAAAKHAQIGQSPHLATGVKIRARVCADSQSPPSPLSRCRLKLFFFPVRKT